ncbi:MAG: glycosyltransferase [Pseudomonadales bacterium]|nr:glycosyltransferase [Pseudomonadales bacterium]
MSQQQKLSILQVCHDTKGPFIGVCRQYAAAFEGHEVTTVFLKGVEDYDTLRRVGGTRVLFLEKGKSKQGLRGLKLNTLCKMAKLLRRNHYDIAIAHRYKALYIVGILSLFFTMPRILAVAHEYNMFLRLPRRLFFKVVGKKIRVAGVSKVVTEEIALRCPSLLHEKRLYTLYNTVPKLRAETLISKADAREKLGLKTSSFVIGTIGRLVKKKNHKILIRAFSELGIDESQLLIIGSGPEESQLRHCASELDVEASVIFAGYLSDAYRYLNAYDIFVLSSNSEEAFGIVLLEAMQARVAIVSSNAPGPKEVLGSSATLFDVDNADDLREKLKLALGRSGVESQKLIDDAYERLQNKFGEAEFKSRLFSALDIA